VQEHNDVVASVDELLRLQAALFPRLQVCRLEHLVDFELTMGDLALLKPPTVPWNSTSGSISQDRVKAPVLQAYRAQVLDDW
jgi:hypothetical protein